MREKQETFAEIIATIRYTYPLEVWNKVANRLEAAHKRELAKIVSKNWADSGRLGDAAKLREAMLSIKADILKRRSENFWYITDSDILEKIDAALAASPRNCDVGTAKEQNARFERFCFTHRSIERCCADCPLSGEPCCELAWAQMPYEKGDNDGSK
jgi:hypothetical protein